MQYWPFCDISFNIMTAGFFLVESHDRISFLLRLNNIPVYVIPHFVFLFQSVDILLGYFYLLVETEIHKHLNNLGT